MEDNEQLIKLWNRLKSYKKLYKIIDIIGVVCMIIMVFFHYWFVAFILFIMFFPDEVIIIRFIKKLFKPAHALEYKECNKYQP